MAPCFFFLVEQTLSFPNKTFILDTMHKTQKHFRNPTRRVFHAGETDRRRRKK